MNVGRSEDLGPLKSQHRERSCVGYHQERLHFLGGDDAVLSDTVFAVRGARPPDLRRFRSRVEGALAIFESSRDSTTPSRPPAVEYEKSLGDRTEERRQEHSSIPLGHLSIDDADQLSLGCRRRNGYRGQT